MPTHPSPTHPRRHPNAGFSLIELLITVSVIALLFAIILPAVNRARLQAKVAVARAELYQISLGLLTYHHEWNAYPLAAQCCFGGGADADNYNHIPPELCGHLALIPRDVFNPNCTYKYTKPGIGWGNGALSSLGVWVPKDFPYDDPNSDPNLDALHYNEKTSPVKFALWSVGPSGPKDPIQSAKLRYPVPKRTWYHLTDGWHGQGVITIIQTKDGFIQSHP